MIKSLTPVLKTCNICKDTYSRTVGEFYNPMLYVRGCCFSCNDDILRHLLNKGHRILNLELTKDR